MPPDTSSDIAQSNARLSAPSLTQLPDEVDDNAESNNTVNKSAADKRVVSLVLAKNTLQLSSGDVWPLSVWGVDDQAQKITDISDSLECLLLNGDTGIIKLFPSCQIAAMSPGNAQLQVRYTTPLQRVISSETVVVEVVAKPLNVVNGIATFLMNDWQEALWLTFPGLEQGAFYRATINGRLPNRTVLEVIPDFWGISKGCQNTLPVGANRVACYFYAQSNAVTMVIKNFASEAFQGQVLLEPAQDKAQFSVSYSPLTAKPIFADTIETHYVFANEIGQSSTNFFRFTQNTQTQIARQIKVTLFDYDYRVRLSLLWGKKVCTNDMMTISPSQISCTLFSDDATDVIIAVDGNNQIELLNAPAAVEGGTQYSLLVEYL